LVTVFEQVEQVLSHESFEELESAPALWGAYRRPKSLNASFPRDFVFHVESTTLAVAVCRNFEEPKRIR
jgi:hypothetical protein